MDKDTPSSYALQLAATAWCKDTTNSKEMDVELCLEFAKMLDDVPTAFNTLRSALQDDEDYAWSWHSNIAMAVYDVLPIPHLADMTARRLTNEAAANFMFRCFKVDMTNNKLYNKLMSDLVCDG